MAGGVISLLVGLMLYLMLPWSGLWVVGTLIAVELIFHGVSWIQFGLTLRKDGVGRRPPAATATPSRTPPVRRP